MKRLSRVGLTAAVLVLMSCGAFFVNRPAYNEVKKAALVQYALNPHLILGVTQSDEARQMSATQNVGIFNATPLGGYTMMSLDEVKANAAYAAMGKDKEDGWYTAPGLRFLAEGRELDNATLTPDQAKKLCEALGVDAVIAVSEGWYSSPYALGFRTHLKNQIVINMYGKDGQKIYGDAVQEESNEGLGSPGGITAGDTAQVALNAKESFEAGLKAARAKLDAK